MSDLAQTAAELRGRLVEISCAARTPHLGSSLSCADITTAAYWHALRVDPQHPDDPNRDRFLLSKGHAATTLYIALHMRGFYGDDVMDSYAKPGGVLPEHPSPGCAPGIDSTSGSLGHGLPMGVGMTMAGKIQGKDFRTYVLMSDGECNEGSVWEAALMAPAQGLDRLCAIVDFNKWQATGRSAEVMALAPLREKFESFGWSAHDVDGHDVDALADILDRLPDGTGKPVAIIAHTLKGKGVSFMEDDNNWHYRIPTPEEVERARAELGLAPKTKEA